MHSALLPPAYDELVSLCYESVLDASCWPTLLNKLSTATGRQFGATGFGWPSAEPDPEGLRPIDPLADDEPALPTAQGVLPADMPQPGEHARIYLALLTTIDTQPGGAHDALLAGLAPHLMRASRLAETLGGARQGLQCHASLLDSLHTPLWLVGAGRQVAYRNAAAARYLQQSDAVLAEYASLLRPLRIASGRLETALSQAIASQGPPRPIRLAAAESSGADLFVTPLPAGLSGDGQMPALAAVSVLDPKLRLRRLADLFHLSRAEAQLAELLLEGRSLAQCATRLDVTVSTVRSQLRALFHKTGTHRQAELVCLLLRTASG